MTGNIKYCSVLILAGGESSRMKFPKPWLKKDYYHTFLSSIIHQYRSLGFINIVVVLNENFAINEWRKNFLVCDKLAKIVLNTSPEKGRLHSIFLGLKGISSPYTLLHNVDNPYVNNEAINSILKNYKDDITIPQFEGKGGHPVLFNLKVRKEIIENYHQYGSLKDVFEKFNRNYVNVNSNTIHQNINTPSEYRILMDEVA